MLSVFAVATVPAVGIPAVTIVYGFALVDIAIVSGVVILDGILFWGCVALANIVLLHGSTYMIPTHVVFPSSFHVVRRVARSCLWTEMVGSCLLSSQYP
jgi:hypothetical protein